MIFLNQVFFTLLKPQGYICGYSKLQVLCCYEELFTFIKKIYSAFIKRQQLHQTKQGHSLLNILLYVNASQILLIKKITTQKKNPNILSSSLLIKYHIQYRRRDVVKCLPHPCLFSGKQSKSETIIWLL